MTPQERTELQRLAEALKLAERVKSQWAGTPFKDGWPPIAEHAYILASALIPLAAESEELRAELEKERAENVGLWAFVTSIIALDSDYSARSRVTLGDIIQRAKTVQVAARNAIVAAALTPKEGE